MVFFKPSIFSPSIMKTWNFPSFWAPFINDFVPALSIHRYNLYMPGSMQTSLLLLVSWKTGNLKKVALYNGFLNWWWDQIWAEKIGGLVSWEVGLMPGMKKKGNPVFHSGHYTTYSKESCKNCHKFRRSFQVLFTAQKGPWSYS